MELNMRVLYFLAAFVLFHAKAQEDDEAPVLAALKSCSEKVTPSEDDLTQISDGQLKSATSRAMITCLFKGSDVMRDKSFQKEKAVIFLRALVPGDDSDKIDVFKKLSEKCASSVSKTPEKSASEEEAAVTIYECLVKEGRSMGLAVDADGDSPTNSTGSG